MPLSAGTLLNNRYRIVSVLGQGGMGAVYRAEDLHLGVPVAVKENLFLSEEYTRQFKHEANILASLRHPNLPRVGDYFDVENQGQYLIMDYIDGEDLRQRIERVNVLGEDEVILIGTYMCDALQHLHTRKPPVVHRDIKPGNIKITPEGEVVLVDFGLAKRMLLGQDTTTGARAMTPGYSPPEQYGTARTDGRTDVYSLGATLYAALTGVIPEDGLARATGKAQLTPIRQLRPKIDRRLAGVIEKALEVEPENRYQSAEEFRVALANASSHAAEMTRPRYLVAPPPADSQPLTAEELENGSVPASESPRYQMRNAPIPDKPVKKRPTWLPAALLATLMMVAAAFILIDPSLAGLAIGGTEPTPTVTTEQSNPIQPTDLPISEIMEIDPGSPTSDPTATTKRTPTDPPAETAAVTNEWVDQIAFASDRTGIMQIWVMDWDGANQKQVSNMPQGACQPSWSPDAAQIAFISPCEKKEPQIYQDSRIYIMNSDGSDVNMLPVSEPGDFDPAWSPDGDRIAFTSLRVEKAHIFSYDFTDDSLDELSDTRYPDIQPVWHPDGKQLAFVRQAPYPHIWIMSDQGLTEFQFSLGGAMADLWPDWSSDGEVILFSRSQIDNAIPWLTTKRYEDRGTAREYRIPENSLPDPGPVAGARLSPDMDWIVFEGWPDGRNHDIFLMDENGENRMRLTTDPGFDFGPAWRPKPSEE